MSATFTMAGIIGEGSCTAAAFGAFAADHPGPVTVYINSPGGSATEGAAILAAFERHGKVTVRGQGIVASAASLAAMGGAEIVLHRDCLFMIHDPAAVAFGTADAHREAADVLDKIADTYARSYARASGNPVERVKAWMKAETWLDASEALALNFCDRIEGSEDAVAVAQFDFTRFQHAPARLVQLARANGWASVTSDTGTKETTDA